MCSSLNLNLVNVDNFTAPVCMCKFLNYLKMALTSVVSFGVFKNFSGKT
jgi:hypothetical protein